MSTNGRRALTDKDGFKLDRGQQVAGAAPDAEMTELAKCVNLTSAVLTALNYLGLRGWKLINITPVPTSALTVTSMDRPKQVTAV